MDELTETQSSTLRFRREVADRFGVLPNFFCSADAAPGLIEELWKFAKSAYLDSPLPSLFKERLLSISRDSARPATASSGTSASSSATGGRPETPTCNPRPWSR